jgi:hypothetical protein
MACRTVKTPRDWSSGCGETSGRVGCVNTADQRIASRRMAPTWASQAVPVEWGERERRWLVEGLGDGDDCTMKRNYPERGS